MDVLNYMGEEFYSYYRFAFVRTSFGLAKVALLLCEKKSSAPSACLIMKMTFEEYIKWRLDHDLILMSDLVCDDDGSLLLDEVFRFENINQEFDRLCGRLKIQATLPHKNIAGKDKSIELSGTAFKEFREAYDKDYRIFGYG